MSDSAPHVKRSRDGEKKKDERTPRGLILRKIAPKNQPFSSMSISWLLDLRKDATAKKGVFTYIYIQVHKYMFLFAKGLSNDGVRVAKGAPCFWSIRPGAGFNTSDFVKEKFRGG